METTTKQTIGTTTAIILAALSLIVSNGLINPTGDNIYFGTNGTDITCKPMICDSLSSVNDKGLQTRCYFFSEELNRTTYKICSEGWIKFEMPENKTIEEQTFINQTIVNQTIINENYISPKTNPVYLICEKKSDVVSECQIINSDLKIIKLENN